MKKTTMIHVKADAKTKNEAQKILEEMGFTLSSVVNGFLKNLVRTREVHFKVEHRLKPSVERGLIKSIKDYKAGKLGKPMNFDEALEHLRGLSNEK